jgi:predicted  nucleic acid-binding Zn-ribbon protein
MPTSPEHDRRLEKLNEAVTAIKALTLTLDQEVKNNAVLIAEFTKDIEYLKRTISNINDQVVGPSKESVFIRLNTLEVSLDELFDRYTITYNKIENLEKSLERSVTNFHNRDRENKEREESNKKADISIQIMIWTCLVTVFTGIGTIIATVYSAMHQKQ